MQTEFDVVYENGMLKPLIALPLENHKRYRIRLNDEHELQGSQRPPQDDTQPDPQRTQEYAWLREHRAEYTGQYVALYGDQLIAHGQDGRAVLRQAKSAGFPRALMIYVEALEAAPFGGW